MVSLINDVPGIPGLKVNADGSIFYFNDDKVIYPKTYSQKANGKQYKYINIEGKRYGVAKLVHRAFVCKNWPKVPTFLDGNTQNTHFNNLCPKPFVSTFLPGDELHEIPGYPNAKINYNGTVITQYDAVINIVKPSRKKCSPSLIASLTDNKGVSKYCYVHHLVAKTFIGEKPEGYFVVHTDGDTLNNHFSNIKYTDKKH
jgi:hypothetical protein